MNYTIKILFSCLHMKYFKEFQLFRKFKTLPHFYFPDCGGKFFIKSRGALKGFIFFSLLLFRVFLGSCDSDDRVSCFFANKCRRVRLDEAKT